MQKNTVFALVILSVALVGVIPMAAAATEGSGDPLARVMNMVTGIQTTVIRLTAHLQANDNSIAGLQSDSKRLAAATDQLQTDSGRIVNRMENTFAGLNEMDQRLVNWSNNDKADIATLYDMYDSMQLPFTMQIRHVNDDNAGHGKGWDPNGHDNWFTIHDSRITNSSVVSIVVNNASCHVEELITDFEEGQSKPGFRIYCHDDPNNGTFLNYTIVNPVEQQ